MRGGQMKLKNRLAMAAALAWLAPPLEAGQGTTSGELLQETFGGRPRAMGQAYAALSDDVFGLAYNPAGLSQLSKAQVAAEYSSDIVDEKLGFFGFAMPLTSNQALGLNFSFLDAGKADIFDSNGTVTRTVAVQSDQLVHLGYSYALRKLPFSLRGNLHLGAGAKFLRSTVAEELKAQTLAADLGLMYARALPGHALGRLGLSLANLGRGLNYRGGKASGSQTDPLPRLLRAGASYQKSLPRSDALTASFELDREQESGLATPSVGFEYLHRGLLGLRLGYRRERSVQPLSFGFGINWKGVGFDYSLSLLQVFGNVHRLSLSYSFNIPWVESRGVSGEAPIELLSREIQGDIAKGRYFYAMENVQKFLALFPKDSLALGYRDQIRAWVHAAFQEGVQNPRYAYAGGHSAFYDRNWERAAERLRKALVREPKNQEIGEFLELAEKKVKEQRELEKLKRDARISYLFELANKAHLAGEYDKALKIFDEILRISQYEPALKLRKEIERQLKKGPPPKAPAKKAPPAAPAPAPARPRQPEKAADIYFQAIRKYGDGDLNAALNLLQEARKLDPESLEVQSTLQRVQKEWDESRKEQTKETRP